MDHPFRLYGHRGAAAHHPENTLRALEAAVQAGADALETDVRLSADGRVVVFHDADGARTCQQPHRLRDRPWAEIATWDAGEGQHPMLLSELLEVFGSLFVNIDVKDDDPEAARRTLEVVQASGRAETVGLGSFHARVARALRGAGWRGQLALTPRGVAAVRLLPLPLAQPLVRGDAVQIPTQRYGIRLDTPRFLSRCHALGLRVDFWTIDDPDEAIALVRAGADGIVTNDPAAIGAALESLRP
ncbi:MAG TPA: glycerophosphodiester phosphodiesterase [Deltaproteobacteria bacterium]|nr:glycerophosphodiester phosphodiesterase [Deltaproteobacteria bacterium]